MFGSSFGQQNNSFSGFGQNNQQQQNTSLFGQQPITPFGGAPAAQTNPQPAAQPSLFGAQPAAQPAFGGAGFGQPAAQQNQGTGAVPFQPREDSIGKTGTRPDRYQTITMMTQYPNTTLTELRYQDYMANRKTPNAQASTFGQTGNTSGVFGAGNTSASSTFGGSANTSATNAFGTTTSTFGNNTSNSLFGQSGNQTTGLFGQNNTNNTQGTGLFGAKPAQTSTFGSTTNSAFGQPSQPAAFGSQPTGLFGQNNNTTTNTTGGLFGQQNNTTSTFGKPTQPSSTGFGFGTTANNTFGNAANANTGTSLFGQNNNNANTTGGGLFGQQNNNTSGGLFGQNNNNNQQNAFGQTNNAFGGGSSAFGQTQNNQAGGLFGQQNNNTATGTGLFGQQNQQQQGTGLFGQQNNNTNNAFGKPATGGLFGQTPAATNNAFGTQNNASAGGLFGAKPATGGLFGAQNNTNTGGGLFGANNNAASTPFGQPNNAAGSTGGLFGANNNTNTNTGGGGLFGNTANKPAAGGLFGTNNNTTSSFGQNNTGGGLFGANNNTATNNANTGGGLFGNTANKPATGGLFGASNTTNTGATGGGLFGNTLGANNTNNAPTFGQTSTAGTSGGLFGNNNNASTSTGGGLFGNTANKPAGGLFNNTSNTNTTGGGLFGANNSLTTTNNTTNNTLGGFGTNTNGLNNTNSQGNLFGGMSQNVSTAPVASLDSSDAYLSNKLFSSIIARDPTASVDNDKYPVAIESNSTNAKEPVGFLLAMNLIPSSLPSGTRLKNDESETSISGDSPAPAQAPISSSTTTAVSKETAVPTNKAISATPAAREKFRKALLNFDKIAVRPEAFNFTRDTHSSTNSVVSVAATPVNASDDESNITGLVSPNHSDIENAINSRPDEEGGENSIREEPFEEIDTSSFTIDKPDNEIVDENGYWISPAQSRLLNMTPRENRHMKEFRVGRSEYGFVEFLQPVDLSEYVNVQEEICGHLVVFDKGGFVLYPQITETPPPGEGLNVKHRVTLYNVFAKNKSQEIIKDPNHPVAKKFLQKLGDQPNRKLVSWSSQTGTCTFEVEPIEN